MSAPTQDDQFAVADLMAETMGFSTFGSAPRPNKRRRGDDSFVPAPPAHHHPGSAANSMPLGSRGPPVDPAALPYHPTLPPGVPPPDASDGGRSVPAAVALPPAAAQAVPDLPGGAPCPPPGPGSAPRVRSDRAHPNPNWFVDYYDVRSNQNPWQALELQRGLQPRGSWPPPRDCRRSGAGGGAAVSATPAA